MNLALARAVDRKVTLRLVPLLFLMYAVASLDRVNLGFAKLQMLTDRGWSDTVYGVGAGLFFLGYVAFDLPSSLAGHKVGIRWWIARILITRGVIVVALAWADNATVFCVLRGLLGAAEAGLIPCLFFLLTQWVPADKRSSANAMLLSALAFAGVVGGPMSGWVLENMQGLQALAGWQWLFILSGSLSVLLGLATPFILDDTIERAKWLSAQEKHDLHHRVGVVSAAQVSLRHTLGDVLHRPVIWAYALAYFCIISSLYGVAFWLAPLLKNLSQSSQAAIGWISALPYLMAMVTMLINTHIADRTGKKRRHLMLAAFTGAFGLMACGLTTDYPMLGVVALTLAACGCLSVLPLFWAFPTATLQGASVAAGIAFVNAVGNIGGFASPIVVAQILNWGGSLGFALAVIGGMQLVGSGMVWGLTRPTSPTPST
jgi:sugar phosphate permease